jgi:hypothetical protein
MGLESASESSDAFEPLRPAVHGGVPLPSLRDEGHSFDDMLFLPPDAGPGDGDEYGVGMPELADPAELVADGHSSPDSAADGHEAEERPLTLRGLLAELGSSACEAVTWHAFALAADALAPGAGRVVQGLRVVAGAADAVLSVQAGEGFDFKISAIDLPGGYSFDARFRLLDAEGSGAPFGINVGWNTLDAKVESDGKGADAAVVFLRPEDLPNGIDSGGADIIGLVERVLEYTRAAGKPVAELVPSAVVLIDHSRNRGLLTTTTGAADRPRGAMEIEIPGSRPSCWHRAVAAPGGGQCPHGCP